MCRTLNQVITSLPADLEERINKRFGEFKNQVESLTELRKISGKVQTEIAAVLKIKQPSVSKLEKRADMCLSTLRDYVRAIGGELDLVVRMPRRPALHLRHFADSILVETLGATAPKRASAVGKRAAKTR